MLCKPNKCIIRVQIDIETGDAHTQDVPGRNNEGRMATYGITPRINFFDENDERLQRNLKKIEEDKYRGYAEKVDRNEREGRNSTYERQEGV